MGRRIRKPAWRVVVAVLAALLTATMVSCSNKAKPPVPTLNLSYQAVKTFSFNWVDVEGEASYKLLEDENGSGVYQEIATPPANAEGYDLEVFLPRKTNASYMLAACNEAGCSESNKVGVDSTQLVKAVGYLKAANTGAGDFFGASIAIAADGDTLAVGASGEDSNGTSPENDSAQSSGAVYVFTHDSNGNWNPPSYLKAPNSDAKDAFGSSLAISDDGRVLAVGAAGEASDGSDLDDNSLANSGAVYVFVRTETGSWIPQAYLKAPNPDASDYFGRSLALSADGKTLVVGAEYEDGNGSGFGDNSLSNSGAVYVFGQNETGWNLQSYLKATNAGRDDHFGSSLAISADGKTLAVGATGEAGDGSDPADDSLSESGAVYVFTRGDADWTQQAYLKAANARSFARFGGSVSLSTDGATLAIGSMGESSATKGFGGDQDDSSAPSSGAVYIFTYGDTSGWKQTFYLKAPNTEENDYFGRSVALSADGDVLAAGADGEDSNATNIGGNQDDNSALDSGAVYVF